MLSRTADHLFWMARYTERAENTARLLDVNVQTALLPQSAKASEQGWRALLGISELEDDYDLKYAALTQRDVLDFMVRDPGNPSSIAACLTSARENARAVRGTLTTDVWETQNTTWLEMPDRLRRGLQEQNPSQFFEWVKHRSHLSRGVTNGTMLKDEAFYFIRLGTFLERADNTARILDVKFHGVSNGNANGNANGGANGKAKTNVVSIGNALQQKIEEQHQGQSQSQRQSQSQSQSQDKGANQMQSQGQSQTQGVAAHADPHVDPGMPTDFYFWAAILHSVSAFEIYRKVYRDVITPARVAELLMLRSDMPRSLLACLDEVVSNLKQVGNDVSADTERFAGKLHAELEFARIEEILEGGLHDYLTGFLERIFELGNRVSRDFLVLAA
ncbi:hypothetical protein BH11PSE11_BH11PSE11_13710 [soil metagenome]